MHLWKIFVLSKLKNTSDIFSKPPPQQHLSSQTHAHMVVLWFTAVAGES